MVGGCKAEAAVCVAVAEAGGVPAPVVEVSGTEAELPRPEVVIGFACMKSFVVLAEGVHTCGCVWLASVGSVPVADFLAPAASHHQNYEMTLSFPNVFS